MKKVFKHFRYGEKGFTLIELLVVIAILGVLAAVVVPNVSRFMGQGKEEAGLTELHSVQTAVTALKADQSPVLTSLTNPHTDTTNPSNDMTAFPTTASDNVDLFGTVHYLQKDTTEFWYSVLADGTVRGWWTEDGSNGTDGEEEIGVDDPP